MAKEFKRGNREVKKPKKVKPKTATVASSEKETPVLAAFAKKKKL